MTTVGQKALRKSVFAMSLVRFESSTLQNLQMPSMSFIVFRRKQGKPVKPIDLDLATQRYRNLLQELNK